MSVYYSWREQEDSGLVPVSPLCGEQSKRAAAAGTSYKGPEVADADTYTPMNTHLYFNHIISSKYF